MVLDEDDPGYLSQVITFASLAHLFEVFVDIERGDDGSIEVDFDLLGEDRPFITGIELVRYCERHGYYDEYFSETEYGLFGIAVDERMREVKTRLTDVLGTPACSPRSASAAPCRIPIGMTSSATNMRNPIRPRWDAQGLPTPSTNSSTTS